MTEDATPITVQSRISRILSPRHSPAVTTATRHPTPSATDVPTELRDWADAKDLSFSWQTYSPERLSVVHAMGIKPLVYEEEVEDEWRNRIPKALMFLEEGYVRKGNAVLCVEQNENRRLRREEIDRRSRAQLGQVSEGGVLEAEAERLGIELRTPEWADTSRAGNILR